MRKIWDIYGGIHPPENKSQTNQRPIATIPLPDEFVVPLNQHIGSPALLRVAVGDKVLKGEKIAEPQGHISAAVHAPSSGTIIAIEARPMNHASGLDTLCVVIEPDGKEQWIERSRIDNWQEKDPNELIDLLREAGIAGMGGAGFPTAVKMRPRADQHIDTLILNGTECEPYITADDMLMREYATEIIHGVELLSHLLNKPKTILIGVEDNKPEAAEQMRLAAKASSLDIEVVTFPTKYPSGGEKQLIQILTGREVPAGKIPADIGIVLQNTGTARAAYRAITFGEPLIERVTTVVGEALQVQQNIVALIGTPVKHIIDHHGFEPLNNERLIIGGPMMGYAVKSADVPVLKTTNCILVPSQSEFPTPEPQQACIRCGMCAEACPASLLPQQLYWFSRSENFEHLRSHNLFDCIECGACSYVCPSNIPLVQYYRASKGAIRHHDEEKRKAEHSKKRFEFRKERIEKAEAEKEAKRLARKKAAEAAKAKLASEAKSTGGVSNKGHDLKAPPATKPPIDPEKARAKLERAFSSAQSRVDRAHKALDDAKSEGIDEVRLEALAARLKQAEQKAKEAEGKLKAFDDENKSSPTKAEDPGSDVVKDKLSQNPIDKLKKNIATLEKRIATAKEKVKEAQQSNSNTLEALKMGVTKLEEKLESAQKELDQIAGEAESSASPANSQAQELSAAEAAIAKAKHRANELAQMTPEQKKTAQINSLKKRLEKARLRLKDAEIKKDDNIEAFRNSVSKLESKLLEIDSDG